MRQTTLLLALALTACGALRSERIARLSDAQVIASGISGGGIAGGRVATVGLPIAASFDPASRCVDAGELLERLGPTCNHESENISQIPSPSTGDLDDGKPPPTGEVRWYCDEHMVVRIVFAPCDSNGDGHPEGLTPIEMAMTTHAHGGK